MSAIQSGIQSGIQLHLPSYNHLSLTDLVEMARLAHAGGMDQVWVTDNLQSRNSFVVLAAMAAAVPVRLGTAVLVQYFRSPMDVADAAATLTEMMDGRELTLAISRGNPSTHRLVAMPRPVSMLRETAASLRNLLDGEEIAFRDFPVLAEYFNFVRERPYQLSFPPMSHVPVYGGGNAPLSLAAAGELMDGVMWGWSSIGAARSGQLERLMAIAKDARVRAGITTPLRTVAEIKLSMGPNHAEAREHCKRTVGLRVLSLLNLGYTADDFRRMGVEPADVERLRAAGAAGASQEQQAALVTEPMLEALFVAGDVVYCREKMAEVSQLLRAHGFEQIMFSEMGEDAVAATRLCCEQLLPVL